MFKKKEKESEYVSCEDCRHLIKRCDAQKITLESFTTLILLGYEDSAKYLYYCPEHQKPYDAVDKWPGGEIYTRKLVVSIDGTPVGYKKINKKK